MAGAAGDAREVVVAKRGGGGRVGETWRFQEQTGQARRPLATSWVFALRQTIEEGAPATGATLPSSYISLVV